MAVICAAQIRPPKVGASAYRKDDVVKVKCCHANRSASVANDRGVKFVSLQGFALNETENAARCFVPKVR
jgi:hypothetical protein